MTIGELYRGLVITQPVLSRILIQMEQRELVQRVADEKDSRVRNVVLTEKGRQLYSEVWPPASEILKRFTSKFNDDDLEKLIRALNRMDDSDLYEPD